MIQCRACHVQAGNVADLAFHIQATHGFRQDAALIEAMRVADVASTEDEIAFGRNAWVYCRQHMRAHETGWCSVSPRDKIGLGVADAKQAVEKCREWGFELYADRQK